MFKTLLNTLCRIALLSCIIFPLHAQNKNQIGTSVANALLARYQPTINALTHHGWDHSNSVIMHALEKIYLKNPDERYLAYIKKYADEHINAEGDIKGLLTTLDGLHPGVVCLFLYQQTGEQKYLRAAKKMRDHLLAANSPFNKTPDGAYWHKNNAKYQNVASVDGLYMVYPYLIRYGLLANDKVAVDQAVKQILLISERSFNIKSKLPYHAWNYDKSKSWAHPVTGTASQFWSRASGWYAMALVDVLEYLPKQHAGYAAIKLQFTQLAQGLKAVQNPTTGFWHHILDRINQHDQAHDNYPESSGTGMITYALKKGLKLGLLDQSFIPVTDHAWQAIQSKLSTAEDGLIQINSFAPGMSPQNDYQSYLAKRPVSVPSKGKKQHAHGYMAILLAAAMMEN